MTSQTHTPGPWKIGDLSHDVWSEDGHCVANCGPKRNYSNGMGVSLANARLIAAAPELLAACKAVYVTARSCPSSSFDDAMEKCKAAIAAAEGK